MTDDEVREANDDWVCDRLESIHIIALRSLDGQHDMRRAMEEIAGLSEGFAKIPASETGTGHRRNEPPVEFQVGDRVVLIVRDPSSDEPVGTVESNDFINMRGERLYHVAFPALGIAISVSAGQLQLANS